MLVGCTGTGDGVFGDMRQTTDLDFALGGTADGSTASNDAGIIGAGAAGSGAADAATNQGPSDLAYAATDMAPTCPPSYPRPTGPYGSDASQDMCVTMINMLRAMGGKPALARYVAAETCVTQEAWYDSGCGSHASAGGCGEGAQNVCPGFYNASPKDSMDACLPAMWAEGPPSDNSPAQYQLHGHYINMSGPYTKVACGFYRTPAGYLWFHSDFFP